MTEQTGGVSREIRGHLYLLGLNRSSKRNAFDSHMIHDLSLALTEYEDNPELVDEILRKGTEKARETAKETMKKVKKAMMLDYFE